MAGELSDQEIDYLEKRAQGQIDGTGLPWKGIGPDELLWLISEIKRLRRKDRYAGDGNTSS